MLLSLSMTKRKVMTLARARDNIKQYFLEKKKIKKVSVWEDHQNWSWVKIVNFEANSSGFQATQQSPSLKNSSEISVVYLLPPGRSPMCLFI